MADLPVRKILYARHIKADMALPFGRVLHDCRASAIEKAKESER
ncbi:hypothetical protein [Acidisoma sp. C75]